MFSWGMMKSAGRTEYSSASPRMEDSFSIRFFAQSLAFFPR